MITIQYLEEAPELAHLDVKMVVEKLRSAGERLRFSHLLVGWHLPPRLLEACRMEAERLEARFLRWHPLLTGDGSFKPRLAWQVVGLTGRKVMGYHDMPEFTFVCPNHPEVQETIHRRLEDLLREGAYQGFFLDRVRFPSPAMDPLNNLGCFCEHCRRKAAGFGIDLERIRGVLLQLAGKEQGRLALVQSLLGGKSHSIDQASAEMLHAFFGFRFQSVTDFIAMLTRLLKASGMEIGLDCFSPSLTTMVGQDLKALSGPGVATDWIKVMSYAHALGPAGLPFELLGLHNYLITATRLSEADALSMIGEAISLPLNNTRKTLEIDGLSAQALEGEVARGVKASRVPILAGVELVEIEGVTRLNKAQIEADLAAVRRAGAAGISISWDLRHIPLERLDLVRQVYLDEILHNCH